MDSSISEQNEKITGNGAELEKVLGGIGKSRKSFTLPILCNLAKLVKNYLGLTFRLHRSAPRQTENYVPIVVLGLSTTSSSSSASDSSSPTFSQESTGSTPIPESIECESADE